GCSASSAHTVPGVYVTMHDKAASPCGSVMVMGILMKPGEMFERPTQIMRATSRLELKTSTATRQISFKATMGCRGRARSGRNACDAQPKNRASAPPSAILPGEMLLFNSSHNPNSRVGRYSQLIRRFMAVPPAERPGGPGSG